MSPGADATRGQPIEVGVDYSLGYLLVNEGKQPAMLERVRVLGVTGPIEVIGVLAAPHPGTRGSMISLFGFPPEEYPARPLSEEHVVPVPTSFGEAGSPDQGLQLEVGVRATGAGVGRVRGIEVVYKVGDRRYRIVNPGGGVLCAPASAYVGRRGKDDDCGGPATDPHFDNKFVDFRALAIAPGA
ncbi:MAG: hypothetical protein QOF96_2827 [Actinomycetota bacterium]|nr:hypothetical protein [Actinomycetota bacterium]